MKLIATFFILFSLFAFGQATPRSVQATGTASISVTPDQAQINVSAVTQAATAQEAAGQNATIATNIQGALAQALGNSGTVKTVNYSVNPIYTYGKDGTSTLTGYTVTNTIQVTLNDLTITGKVIDTATQAGASRIDSLQFTLKDDTDARSQSLRAATVRAKAKADAMAASVGQKTGTDSPTRVPTRVTLSIAWSRRVADRMPVGMPISSAKATASEVSSMVTGRRSRISATTGLPVRHDVPRSPWTRPPIQVAYCRHHGWSRPKNRLSSATISGLTTASAPISCSTTVPGTRRSMRKTSSDRPARVRAIEYSRTAT